MAEARSAASEIRVSQIEEREEPIKYITRSWKKSVTRRVLRAWNSIRNGLWPTPVWNLGWSVLIFSVLLIADWKWAEPITMRLLYIADILHIHAGVPFILRIPLIAFAGGVTFFIILMYLRRWSLQLLLSYRGWMYEPPQRQSVATICWGLIVRSLSGYRASTFSYQKSLPSLPVPALKQTMDKFLDSIKPLYGEDSDQYRSFAERAKEFETGLGPKLQRILHLKSWWAQNWVTDWWEKYIYLMGRSPISINSNYYITDHGKWRPTHRQVSRAASAVHTYLGIKWQLDREMLTPLVIRSTIPLCMAQYERAFSATRIPGEEVDELKKFASSKHIAVSRRGVFYTLHVYDQHGKLLTPQSLEKQFQWIIEDADRHVASYSAAGLQLPALTSMDRTAWAQCRNRHFSSGLNKESLYYVESAIFHVVLETGDFDTWDARGKHLLHGSGSTFWFDKTFTMLFFNDGKMGINAEHSWADAPVIAHVSEHNLAWDVMYTRERFTEDGYCQPSKEIKYPQALTTPQRLVWELPASLSKTVLKAVTDSQQAADDLDLKIADHLAYGKGFIKTCKVSPDAYVQLALQLAYFKDSGGKLALTYEASMTRLYLGGRTETVRSLTTEVAQFVRAMQDKSRSRRDKISLLRDACDRHAVMYKDAMNGQGFDRHLFGLYVACRGLGYDSEFLHDALMIPWTLSTSQQPQQQLQDVPDCNQPKYQDMICPGGGFGPVSDKGYGVSYMIPGDHRLFFHVSSKRSSGVTDSARFMRNIFESLQEIRELFEEKGKGEGEKGGGVVGKQAVANGDC